jgi:L-fucose isomerase-like protein
VPIFGAIHHLRRSKMLIVGRNREKLAAGYTERYGTAAKFFDYPDLKAAFDAADARKAEQAAAEFTRAALRVVEPKPQEIRDALRFYLGVLDLLKREKANAITVDCFGGILAGKMPAYPCVAWSKLNDVGMYGVCEGDVQSTMTQMLVTSYSGMPGFVTDPVFDLSRNEVIHAHCVAATKMKGIHGPSYPYILRDHLETAEGAVMQVLMPSNETITMARFVGADKFLVSTGEVTGVPDSDRGCRTQIRTRVADAEKMLQGYGNGLHRVIFYGDHVRAIERMGRLMGFQVIREG